MQGVCSRAGEQRRRVPLGPVRETSSVVGGQWMPRLTTWLMVETLLLHARGYDHALRSTVADSLDSRHVAVSCQRYAGHVEPRGEPGDRRGKRMSDACEIEVPPRAFREIVFSPEMIFDALCRIGQ